MKRTSILVALLTVALMAGLGCGDPAIGTLQSITLTSSSNSLQGEGSTLQLSATGNYSSPTPVDISNKVTYAGVPTGFDASGNALLAPPQTVTISPTGLVTAVTPFVCTYDNVGTATTPAYVLTGSYAITATYKGITSQPVYVGVGSAAGNGPGGACGP